MNKILLIIFTIFVLSPFCFAQEVLKDDISVLNLEKIQEPEILTKYNYSSVEEIPVNLKIINEIRSEKDLYEGQIVKFRVTKDVYDSKNLYIRRGSVLESKVKIIITSGMNGIPASIILGDFKVSNLHCGCFSEKYEIFGQDRSLIVYPLKWALTILPPTGTLTNLIKGGHAKLKTDKTVTIYYYPQWI